MQNKKGFTLVELAVVMTIIGLLIGGILKFQELRNNAELQHTIKAYTSLAAVSTSFRDLYGSLPGDMSKATRKITGCNAANFCVDGDSNGIIGVLASDITFWKQTGTATPQIETSMYWKHLALSGLITGINPSADPATPVFGSTHLPLKLGGGLIIGYHNRLASGVAPNTPESGHFLWLVKQPQAWREELIRIREASYIDKKIDDGLPNSGWLLAEYANSGQCKSTDTDVGVYNDETGKDICTIWYSIGQ